MNKEDYKNNIEEHRKPITLDEEERTNSRISRRSPNKSVKQVKMKKNPLLPILFAVFILIPVGFLFYIQVFYEPKQNETAVLDTDEFEFKQNEEDRVNTEIANEVDDKDTEANTSVDDEEGSSNDDETNVPEEESPTPVEETPVEETDKEEATSNETHTVKSDETLYRIAMNYYNTPDAVQKIKDANGLTSDSISAGQVLILP
jgi:colicin import membrane protein